MSDAGAFDQSPGCCGLRCPVALGALAAEGGGECCDPVTPLEGHAAQQVVAHPRQNQDRTAPARALKYGLVWVLGLFEKAGREDAPPVSARPNRRVPRRPSTGRATKQNRRQML